MRSFWRRVPLRARLLLMLAVGFTFATIGFVTDIVSLGATQPWRLAFNVAFAGTIAVCYLLVALEAGPLWIARFSSCISRFRGRSLACSLAVRPSGRRGRMVSQSWDSG